MCLKGAEKVQKTKKDIKVHINHDFCKRCEICVKICPFDVLATDPDGYPEIVAEDKCTACGLCETHCPDFAIWIEVDGENKEHPAYPYLRMDDRMPNVWCPGCGIGMIFYSIIRAVKDLGIPKDKVAMVSGIGCTGRMPGYADFNTLHTTHGRALAFSIGLKLANPELTVITVLGDGDGLAIGGNHLIHAARRNVDITAVLVNNFNYGMTGGQVSPTTPQGGYTTTSPYGNYEPDFDSCELVKGAGANFVARGTTFHITLTDQLIKKGLQTKGFSFIEVISHCPTYYGRFNEMPDPFDMLNWQKKAVYRAGTTPREGRLPIGVIHTADHPDYMEILKQRTGMIK